jgi:two-component system CheB/CheR fusion protein
VTEDRESYRRARQVVIDAVPSALVVVDHSGMVAVVNAAAERLLGLSGRDIGRPFEDLEISSRPVELLSAVERVQKEQCPLLLEGVGWAGRAGSVDCYDIQVLPLDEPGAVKVGVAVIFIEVTLPRRFHEELEHTNRVLETAHEELQSTIAQLETTSEELQSTNVELEVMNAALQSTNEELQTIHEELRMRTAELDEANDFLESLLISQPGGLVVVDRELRISVWNDQSAELWGLRTDEAPGQHFLNIDIGLPVEELRQPIRAVLAGESTHQMVDLHATNRRGREFRCRVTLTPLINRARQIRGVILLTEEVTS